MRRQKQRNVALIGRAARSVLLVIAACLLVASCTLVSVNDTSHFTDAEGRIPETLLAEIQPRTTNKSWIYAHFGNPLHVSTAASGQEIFTYPLTRVHRKDATLLFLIRYRGVERKIEYFHVVFDGDVVSNHWIDGLPVAQTADIEPGFY